MYICMRILFVYETLIHVIFKPDILPWLLGEKVSIHKRDSEQLQNQAGYYDARWCSKNNIGGVTFKHCRPSSDDVILKTTIRDSTKNRCACSSEATQDNKAGLIE